MTIVRTICARFCSVRVTSSVMSAFVCSVSVSTREMIWPAFVRENQPSGRRCMWRNTVSRRSRVIVLLERRAELAGQPDEHVLQRDDGDDRDDDRAQRADPVGGIEERADQPVWSRDDPAVAVAERRLRLNSAFRNGMSSVNENASSAAATTLHAMLPAIRHQCGRRKPQQPAVHAPATSWREQRHRQDALLRRHAAVQERSAIPALVLAQLRRDRRRTSRPSRAACSRPGRGAAA